MKINEIQNEAKAKNTSKPLIFYECQRITALAQGDRSVKGPYTYRSKRMTILILLITQGMSGGYVKEGELTLYQLVKMYTIL